MSATSAFCLRSAAKIRPISLRHLHQKASQNSRRPRCAPTQRPSDPENVEIPPPRRQEARVYRGAFLLRKSWRFNMVRRGKVDWDMAPVDDVIPGSGTVWLALAGSLVTRSARTVGLSVSASLAVCIVTDIFSPSQNLQSHFIRDLQQPTDPQISSATAGDSRPRLVARFNTLAREQEDRQCAHGQPRHDDKGSQRVKRRTSRRRRSWPPR